MIPITTMAGRDVALFGLGGSGMATARALREGGANAIVWDDNPGRVDAARAEGFEATDLRDAEWRRFAALVLSPGVPLTHPTPHWTVELAKTADVDVVGDVELFCRERAVHCSHAPFVAITGTNGKSTTTALVAHLLRAAGRDVQMGGNIGVPILELEPPASDRVHVVECSSYQIDLAPSLNPSVGVLLNITPDHLDRHGTFERYAAIKERLVTASDTAVVCTDDEATRRIAKGLHASRKARPGSIVALSVNEDPDAWVTANPSLRGPHNAQNAGAALAVCRALGVSDADAQAGLTTFPGLAHRMEQVRDLDGLIFVNDSKATNAESVAPALGSFDRVHWIAGGLPKDGGIQSLRALFSHIKRAYLIGEAAPQFAATLGDTVPYEISATLDVAVAHAARDAKAAGGGVILFSPAAASFDQFRNFEERGKAFRAAVEALEV